jgi:hypothetical protein
MWRTTQFFGGFTEIAGGNTEKTVQVNSGVQGHLAALTGGFGNARQGPEVGHTLGQRQRNTIPNVWCC